MTLMYRGVMGENYEIVKADFNEIAALDEETGWNHNNCYFGLLIRSLPEKPVSCLDIGCGKGELTKLLASKTGHVTAVDLAEGMIEKAKAINGASNIDYISGNILDMDFQDGSFDVIATSATAHHLPYEWLLQFAKDKLKKGGRLLILDIARPSSATDYAVWGFAIPANRIISRINNAHLHKKDPHSRAVWEKHGEHDTYMRMGEIRRLAGKLLPGASVRRMLLWRYVLTWTK